MAKRTSTTNERELISKLSEWFNANINRNKFPFKETTNESPAKYDSKTYFGDIVLWINREARQAYSYIEIKPPFDNKEDLETFRKKAVDYGVKYCFTWDFQSFNAYELKNNKLSLHTSEPMQAMNNINDSLRGDVQATIKKYIARICDEIINLNDTGKFRQFKPDKVFFVNYIRETVNKLVPQFEKHYSDIAKDKSKRTRIISYCKEQGIALNDPAEYYKLIARQSVYSFVTKIIFYLTIRRYFNDLPDLYINDEPDLERFLKIAFAKAQEKDWQAVFEESEIEEFGIPKSCYNDLHDLFSEMKVYHFGELPEDVIGELFEEIIDPAKRHQLGQYFTNENLVDFILGFVVNKEDAFFADTTCGSGTFLIRIYDRLKHLSRQINHNQLLEKIWGFDIAKFPAELATINLFRQNGANFENFPRVRRTDIFKVNKGDSFDFPPPSANIVFKKVNVKMPEFSAIVGNFPFIRQELIEKEEKGYKLYLTKVLAKDYFLSYQKLFTTSAINDGHIDHLKKLSPEQFTKEIHRYVDKGSIQLRLSGQADIYTYIFIHTATLLAENGMFAIITSNSWLDVSYGSVLKEFFLDHFKIKVVIGSWAEPWFDDAAVNTVVTVLEKENNAEARGKNIARFVKLKKKFAELIPYQDLKLESIKRWQTIDSLVDLIETAEHNSKTESVTEDISSLDDEKMRVRLVKQSFLEKELKEKGELAKWGKYLRAPDVYFDLLDKCKDKLIPLKDIAEVRRGYTTGINEFFYLEIIESEEKAEGCVNCKNARGWEGLIEEKHLRPVIKSPKESESITIDPAKLKYKIFLCNESKAELRKNGNTHALKYIEWGEKQRTKENIPWTEVPSVQGRTYWWGIEIKEFSNLLWPKAFNDRFPIIENNDFFVADRLYEITLFNKKNLNKVKYILNSTLQYLFIEINGRINLGEGALDNMTYEAELCETVNPSLFDATGLDKKILNRKILPTFNEVKQKDRKELDTKILEALGLDAEIYLPKIYDGLCELVKERLELPKMRKKKQKEDKNFAFDKVKEDVIADCLPDGTRKFPQAFYTKGNYEELEFETYSTNGKPLTPDSFFNNYQMKTEDGETIFEVDSEAKAEFAEILSRQSGYQIKIPAKEKIVEQILKNYHAYIKELRAQLEADAKQKTHEWSIAEKMAKEILEEFGV
ncbi:MAG: N-6 DNA methylase [Melioribacteraceae bacterium]